MIPQNEEELRRTGILDWRTKGIKGIDTVIAVLDDEGAPHPYMDYAVTPLTNHEGIGHGTNVAKVIHEVLPYATVVMLNAFGKNGNFDACIQWIVENKPDAVNVSYTTFRNDDYFEPLRQANIPVICASGNGYNENSVSKPARYKWTAAIGAYANHINSVKDYSNGGELLDAVNFTDIYIPTSDGYERSFSFGGTSASSPLTTAMVGMVQEVRRKKGHATLKGDEIRAFIQSNSQDILEPGHDNKSGYGLFTLPNLDAYVTQLGPALTIEMYQDNDVAYVNGVAFTLQQALTIINGRSMLPVRNMAELAGFNVSWDGATNKVTLTK
jgi:hypothetical protein